LVSDKLKIKFHNFSRSESLSEQKI